MAVYMVDLSIVHCSDVARLTEKHKIDCFYTSHDIAILFCVVCMLCDVCYNVIRNCVYCACSLCYMCSPNDVVKLVFVSIHMIYTKKIFSFTWFRCFYLPIQNESSFFLFLSLKRLFFGRISF